MYHTMILTDGTQQTVDALAIGPAGVISGHPGRPILYLKEAKQGRYWRDPQAYDAEDLPALQERIHQAAPPNEPPWGAAALPTLER